MLRMKRTLSDSECEDGFDDCKDGEPSGEYGVQRKRRRGVIEKRRRDRINTSLCELRRLVPTAFEKQGSAKLEKAEILQMTVDHLKLLHAKGLDALAYDPNKFAMDYHNIGFRECAAEVARYLVTVEGMDIQDPMRLRLMSHLQCYSAQRELANKQHTNSWGFQAAYPGGAANVAATSGAASFVVGGGGGGVASGLVGGVSVGMGGVSGACEHMHPSATVSCVASAVPATLPPTAASVASSEPNRYQPPVVMQYAAAAAGMVGGHHGQQPVAGYGTQIPPHVNAPSGSGGGGGGSKPYRPWGAELAY